MNLQVEWSPPIPMRRVRSLNYDLDLDKVPDSGGVYVFGRRWGDSFEALYVGKALNVRSRVNGQLNNLRLMSHIKEAKAGNRIVLAGTAKPRRGQQMERVLPLIERSLIRYFLSEGHDLVNIQGTLLRRHEVVSTNRPMRFVPSRMYIDR